MNNQELSAALASKLPKLRDLNEEAIKIARDVIGKSLYITDLYFCSMLNKSIQLTDGFVELIESRNLVCAGILLRINLDNCLRLYAMLIAEDPNNVVDYIMQGKKIEGLKDRKGHQLKDWYLKNELDKYDNRFKAVYENTSGYVHFSEKGFFQSVSVMEGEEKITIHISHEIPEKANKYIVECVEAYMHFLRTFYSMFKLIIQKKIDYDQSTKEV